MLPTLPTLLTLLTLPPYCLLLDILVEELAVEVITFSIIDEARLLGFGRVSSLVTEHSILIPPTISDRIHYYTILEVNVLLLLHYKVILWCE